MGDPRGRPSRIQHGFVSFVRGGVPRPCGVRTDPNEAIGNRRGRRRALRRDSVGDGKRGRRQAWATTSVAPTPEQLGDEARVGATLAVAHPESSTASFPSYAVASRALAASRIDPNEAIGETGVGDGAPCGRDSVGDHKGRPYGFRGLKNAGAKTPGPQPRHSAMVLR